jgi:hypothetical protein
MEVRPWIDTDLGDLTLEQTLAIAPSKVGANLIVGEETLLSKCVSKNYFDVNKARAILRAGADPDLAFGRRRFRALNRCGTVDAAKFLLEEAKASLVFRVVPLRLNPPSVWSIVNFLTFLPPAVSQYLIFSSAADDIVARCGSLIPAGMSVPDAVRAVVGLRGKDMLFRLLGDSRVETRLGYTKSDLSGEVSHYISYAYAYPSN